MKNILIILLLFVVACTTSKKHLQHGHYDAAIAKAVKKLRKKPEKQKEMDVLREAWRIANERDSERINYHRLEGNPEKWEAVFNIYLGMKSRQNLVNTLPAYTKGAIGFTPVNYDEEILQAKKNAAEYLYAHALKLLESASREDARRAHDALLKVKSLYGNFRDVDEQIRKARRMGTSFVLFGINNRSPMLIPKVFDEDLRRLSMSELNGAWIEYHTTAVKDITYDYMVGLNIKTIDISPERVKEVHYEEKKEMEDGWEYRLDSKGNVAKDSLGNDIKVKKFKTIHCKVIESLQTKAAIIGGTLDYVDKRTGQLIHTEPLSVESVFEHSAALAIGDVRALKPETLAKTRRGPVPFPTDADIIAMTGDAMKARLKDVLWRNKGLLK